MTTDNRTDDQTGTAEGPKTAALAQPVGLGIGVDLAARRQVPLAPAPQQKKLDPLADRSLAPEEKPQTVPTDYHIDDQTVQTL